MSQDQAFNKICRRSLCRTGAAHPDAARRDLAEQRVEISAVAPLVNRVNPDEHAIERGELCAHGLEDIVLVDHRFRIDANVGERCEDRGAAASCFIASP